MLPYVAPCPLSMAWMKQKVIAPVEVIFESACSFNTLEIFRNYWACRRINEIMKVNYFLSFVQAYIRLRVVVDKHRVVRCHFISK